MLYFIPAWYQKNEWCENEQSWHVRRMHSEFDDTVKQIQLFHRSRAYEYRIILLGCVPNFRHFLHRQSVYHAPYWSCFDAIQEVKRTKVCVMSFRDLSWPRGITFVYTPFVVVAYLKGEKYAQIEFGEDGNPIRIDFYENNELRKKNIYDDRGFISSIIFYEKNEAVFEDYLTESGQLKMRVFKGDGHVEINPELPNYLINYEGQEWSGKFTSLYYESLEQLIAEVFGAYIKRTGHRDIFCVAMHPKHLAVIRHTLSGRKLILSFFSDRCSLDNNPNGISLVKTASFIITDSQKNSQQIARSLHRLPMNMIDITPYDTRVDFGISQQLNVQKILIPVDGLGMELFAEIIRLLAWYTGQNENARIYLFTRDASYNRVDWLLEKTRVILDAAEYDPRMALPKDENNEQAENSVDNEEENSCEQLFFVEQCVDELSVSKCIREQRIVADLRATPELYLQISCISTGIPQIVRTETPYIEDNKNGIILRNIRQLPRALSFYLEGLSNWNEAMVNAYEIGKQFTTERLLEEWKEVIRTVG
jgi:accessory secretory protein Asp1